MQEPNIKALFELVTQAKKEISDGKGMSPDEVLEKLRTSSLREIIGGISVVEEIHEQK